MATKNETLEQWRALEENAPIMPHFRAIPYKATGSKYGTCGIRIDGTPAFIDAVLSHLKELLQGEGVNTRLQLSRNRVSKTLAGHDFQNAETDAECCYIRLHERGTEGKVYAGIERGLSDHAAILNAWTNGVGISEGGIEAAKMVFCDGVKNARKDADEDGRGHVKIANAW